MILNELFAGTKRQRERANRRPVQPKVNPAKLASDYRKIKAMGDQEDYANRLMRDLVSAVGEDKAKDLINTQNSNAKNSSSDPWKNREHF